MIHRITFFRNSTFFLALLGAILYWAAQPPLDWGWLAWIAPVPWIWLIRQERLPGRRPYRSLWLVGFLLWMAILHFLRLPHPATSIGWVATSGYLAFYLPLFVGLSRIGVHRCRLSVVLVAPLVWVGLEFARAHLITGITMGALAYSQYQWLPVIQIASIFGYYGVGYVVMLIASCLGRMLPNRKSTSEQTSSPPAKWTFWPILPAVIVLGATLGYGYSQLGNDTSNDGPSARVGLVQGSIDITMKCDPDKIEEVNRLYIDLSKKAVDEHPDLDLLVWPETMYRDGLCEADADFKVPEEMNLSDEEGKRLVQELVTASHRRLNNLTNYLGVPVLFGLDTIEYTSDGIHFYNSSILALPHTTESESLVNRYDKMHRVLFGEYVPFADIFPVLQGFTPLPTSLTAGKGAQVYEVNGIRFCPNICYENVLPHVIRRQVNELRKKYQEPDVLVNLTNDGWFWGSSELDLHLACAVFRAVECRKPMLIAANTGISAWIDATGAIRARGPRRDTNLIIADVGPHQDWSIYRDGGDWFAGLCTIFCVFLLFFPWLARLFSKKSNRPLATEDADG